MAEQQAVIRTLRLIAASILKKMAFVKFKQLTAYPYFFDLLRLFKEI